MRHIVTIAAVVFSVGAAMQSLAQFNPDALNKMQKEGHKLISESKGARMFKTQNGLCLDSANGLTVETCDPRVRTQQWTMDEDDKLVASDGKCLAGARLAKCSAQAAQTWSVDSDERLANEDDNCLQVQGATVTKGAKVIATKCSKAISQRWR